MMQTVARCLFVFLLVFALFSGLKSQPMPQVVPHFDLLLHFGAFALLMGLWVVGFARPLLGVAVLIAIGLGIELWQGLLLPARTADERDILANISGVFSGWLAMVVLRRSAWLRMG
ncbi:hypothetical protein [Microbulbifer aestuariivivens]|uniref:hypothetical protein n=1 Tax=Microbulbifer aestuariivivens TaxID=1908308 RepID=UPI0031EE0A35